jgi:fatty acid desaturase
VTRSSRLLFLEQFIMAPLGQYLHYEHPLFPGIPNHKLPRVRKLLADAGIAIPHNRSYFGYLFARFLMRMQAPAQV